VQARPLLLIIDPHAAGVTSLAAALQGQGIDAVAAHPTDAVAHAAALLPNVALVTDTPQCSGMALAHALHTRTGIPSILASTGTGAAAGLGVVAHLPLSYQVADVAAIVRTLSPDPGQRRHIAVEVGALRLDPATAEVRLHGRRIDLPSREFQLLHLLMLHTGRVVTPTQANQLSWCRDSQVPDVLAAHVGYLRARLGDHLHDPNIIVAVRTLGYRLDPPHR